MAGQWIDLVIEQLRESGHRARRGYPVGKNPYLTAPAIAVCVEKITPAEKVLRLDIYCPLNLGGAKCEDTALSVMETLAQGDGIVAVGSCSFDENLGLFTQSVTVTFVENEAAT